MAEFMKNAFGKKDEEDRTVEVFRGDWDAAKKLDITDAISTLMKYAHIAQAKRGDIPFAHPGVKMVFQMSGVTLCDPDNPSIGIEAGDFEIEIRRVG